MESKFSFNIDGFKVQITKTDACIMVEAQHLVNSSKYHRILTNDDIPVLTQTLYNNIEEFFPVLQTVMYGPNQGTTFTMTPKGKLNISQKIQILNKEKFFMFEIHLEEVKSNSLERLEEQILKLTARQEEFERTVRNEIDTKMKRLEDYIHQRLLNQEQMMIQLIEGVKKSIPNQGANRVSPTFNPNGTYSNKFYFHNNNKTITTQKWEFSLLTIANWYGLLARDPLTERGKHEFSVLIDTNNNQIMIGIVPGNFENSSCHWREKGTFFYSVEDGEFWSNGSQYTKNPEKIGIETKDLSTQPKPIFVNVKGDIINMIVDFDHNEITVAVNGIEKHRVKTALGTFKNFGYYPAVSIFAQGTGVTFL